MHFHVVACFGKWIHACLIQVAYLIEVASKTGFTVHENYGKSSPGAAALIWLLEFATIGEYLQYFKFMVVSI